MVDLCAIPTSVTVSEGSPVQLTCASPWLDTRRTTRRPVRSALCKNPWPRSVVVGRCHITSTGAKRSPMDLVVALEITVFREVCTVSGVCICGAPDQGPLQAGNQDLASNSFGDGIGNVREQASSGRGLPCNGDRPGVVPGSLRLASELPAVYPRTSQSDTGGNSNQQGGLVAPPPLHGGDGKVARGNSRNIEIT